MRNPRHHIRRQQATNIKPAIRLAEYGTPVSHRLHTLSALSSLWMVRRTLLQEMRG